MGKIVLEKMQFYAYHGCFKEEQLVGTTFEITVSLTVDVSKPAVTDLLEDAVNYQEVYTLVKEQMAIPSKLLERVAQRILNRLLEQYPQIEQASIALSKLNPPLGGQIGRVTIEMSHNRG